MFPHKFWSIPGKLIPGDLYQKHLLIAVRSVVSDEVIRKIPLFERNLSAGNPDTTNAGTKAVGSGKHFTSTPDSIQARTNKNPGSEIAEVPASVTSVRCSPSIVRLTIF